MKIVVLSFKIIPSYVALTRVSERQTQLLLFLAEDGHITQMYQQDRLAEDLGALAVACQVVSFGYRKSLGHPGRLEVRSQAEWLLVAHCSHFSHR